MSIRPSIASVSSGRRHALIVVAAVVAIVLCSSFGQSHVSAAAAAGNGRRHRRRRRLAPTCTGSQIDSDRVQTVTALTDPVVNSLIGKRIVIDHDNDEDKDTGDDPIAAVLRVLLDGGNTNTYYDVRLSSGIAANHEYRRHGPTRTIWGDTTVQKPNPVACFQRYREYVGEAHVAGSELIVRTDCGVTLSASSAAAASDRPVSAGSAEDIEPREKKTSLFLTTRQKKRKEDRIFRPLRAVLSNLHSPAIAIGTSSSTASNIPGIVVPSSTDGSLPSEAAAIAVTITSITGKRITNIRVPGSTNDGAAAPSVIPTISGEEAAQVLTTLLGVDSDPFGNIPLGADSSSSNPGAVSVELQLAPTVDGDRLVYSARNGMSTVMVDAHTLEVVLHCRGEERAIGTGGGYGGGVGSDEVGRQLKGMEDKRFQLSSNPGSTSRRLNNWQEGATCTMNTLYLDNINLQAECQQGTDDVTQETIYRLGTISTLSYSGTQECGCNPYITQYCYPECGIASAPNGVVGTSSTDGSAVADAHYAAVRTMMYIRDVLGIDGVGSDSGQTVPVFTVVYPNDYREPIPCLDNQPEWRYLPEYNSSAVLFYACDENPRVSVDIVAHEIMHGVTFFSSGLSIGTTLNLPKPESFGLVEGFSDILGAVMEFTINNSGDNPDFLVGEEADQSDIIRYMENPDPTEAHIDSVCDSWGQTGFYTFGPLTKAFVVSVRWLTDNTAFSERDCALAMGELFLLSNIFGLTPESLFTDAAVATYIFAQNGIFSSFSSQDLTDALQQGWAAVDISLTSAGVATENCNECVLTLIFNTDTSPGETWDLKDSSGDVIKASGRFPHANTEFNTTFCGLVHGTYNFTLYDDHVGNGIDNLGSYNWFVNGNLFAVGSNVFVNNSITILTIVENGVCVDSSCDCVEGYFYDPATELCSPSDRNSEDQPTTTPSSSPSALPSDGPTSMPSSSPSALPSDVPSGVPSPLPGCSEATYASDMGAPMCSDGWCCMSGPSIQDSLVVSRGSVGDGEPNSPNTLDDCSDGNLGSWHSDESIDLLQVYTTDGSPFAPGKEVEIKATVWAWSTGSQDAADFYYADDANSPIWTPIGQPITPNEGGAQVLTKRYILGDGNLQAVRVNFRYQGSQSPCTSGSYDDRDDLVFTVNPVPEASEGPSSFRSAAPSVSAVPSQRPSSNPSGQPSVAPTTYKPPTSAPSDIPTSSLEPTVQESASPTDVPSASPSLRPSPVPSGMPSSLPSSSPSGRPSDEPSSAPTPSLSPTSGPSATPTISLEPTIKESASPSGIPSALPSLRPSMTPSNMPSVLPTSSPSSSPSEQPSSQPTTSLPPSSEPSAIPTISLEPTIKDTASPTNIPTALPSPDPSQERSGMPSSLPSSSPSSAPTTIPSLQPTSPPSGSCTLPTGSQWYVISPDTSGCPDVKDGAIGTDDDMTVILRDSSLPALGEQIEKVEFEFKVDCDKDRKTKLKFVPVPDRADESPLETIRAEIDGISILRLTLKVNELAGTGEPPNANEKICYKFKIEDSDRNKYEVRNQEINVV